MISYLACFDITNDRNRTRIGKALAVYGNRVQRSVFEITLRNPNELKRLKQELSQFMDDEDDDIRFYYLCQHCRKKSHSADDERIAYFPAAVIL